MKYNCPICGVEMVEELGNGMHKGDPKFGVTLMCVQPSSVCSAQEVQGHGDNAKEAWIAVQGKFVVRKDRD